LCWLRFKINYLKILINSNFHIFEVIKSSLNKPDEKITGYRGLKKAGGQPAPMIYNRTANPFIHSFGRITSPSFFNSWLLCFNFFSSPSSLFFFLEVDDKKYFLFPLDILFCISKSSPNLFQIFSSFSFSISHWIERGLQRNKGRDLFNITLTSWTLLYRIRWLFWFYITCGDI